MLHFQNVKSLALNVVVLFHFDVKLKLNSAVNTYRNVYFVNKMQLCCNLFKQSLKKKEKKN